MLILILQYLALQSPYFKALFYQNFAEKKKAKIELKEVDYDKFKKFLEVVFPGDASVSDYNIEGLLEYGERFQVKSVMDKCEDFLIKGISSSISQYPDIFYQVMGWINKNIKFLDSYRLVNAQVKFK